MTDELVFLPLAGHSIRTFPRPINLKSTARHLLHQLPVEAHSQGVLQSSHSDLILPQRLNADAVLTTSPLTAIFFPKYHADASFEYSQLSKAQAGKMLMRCLANARNLPEHGFSEIVRIVRTIPAYQIRYNHFTQVERVVQDMFLGAATAIRNAVL
jgi:hypothetical protein